MIPQNQPLLQFVKQLIALVKPYRVQLILGILMGILAGLIGRQLFNFIWGRFDKEEPPEATTKDSPLPKVLGVKRSPGENEGGALSVRKGKGLPSGL